MPRTGRDAQQDDVEEPGGTERLAHLIRVDKNAVALAPQVADHFASVITGIPQGFRHRPDRRRVRP